ncbi:MAG: hypothetical protein ACXWXA_09055 [Candidatus Limnocylindrales bacterium]
MILNHFPLELVRERQERLIEEFARARLVENRASINRSSIRRSIGRLVIAAGERIAAESRLELARSR